MTCFEMKKLIGLVAAAALLTSCLAPATETKQTQNKDFRVDFLFENDGCRVYRFFDGGSVRYYANCRGGFSMMDWEYLSGKVYIHAEVSADAR